MRAAPENPRPRPPGIGDRTEIGPTPPALRNARTAGCVSSAGSRPFGVTSRKNASATAIASNAAPRLADDAGTRTNQSSVTAADDRGTGAAWHADPVRAGYGFRVRRQCARPGCSAAATATFTFDSRDLTVWLDTPSDGGARAGELCERHARMLVPPQGWALEDRRGRRESAARQLEATLDVHTPLLERAFRNAGAV